MKKAHSQKICAPKSTEPLPCNIKTICAGRPNDMQTLFDTFVIKPVSKDEGHKVARKKNALKELF